MKSKLIRITTIPLSLKVLLRGQLNFMSNYFEVIGISSADKELKEVEDDEGICVKELEMTRLISPFQDLKSLWNFYKLCKKEKPLMVHSHTPKAGIVGMLGAKLAGVPIRLHTVAGLPLMEASGNKRKLLDFVEKMTYACATKVYPNSKGLYDFILRNNYTSAGKLKVIGEGSSNGIDTSFFSRSQISEESQIQLRESLNIPVDDFVFVFVGRLVGDKGINELIRAFSKLTHSRCKLLLVGLLEPELDPLEENTLKEMNSNPNIISVGFQIDVRPYFAISNALVFPSYREGFPNVVMQAGAMELPSIVSDINGCNEIIVEGVNGTIIPVKSDEAILSSMKNLMQNKEYFNLLQSKARSMITSRYEQKVVWEAILKEYRVLLSERGIDYNV